MTLREDKDRVKTSREELGKFFYDLAKTSFAAMVIGSTISLFTNMMDAISYCIVLSIGIIMTSFFGGIAYVILNKK